MTGILLATSTIQCAEWCARQDGHPDERFAEDQVCTSAECQTDLKLYPQISLSGGGGYRPQYVTVYTERTWSSGTTICMGMDQGGPEMRLTPDEAARIRDALNKQLDAAEMPKRFPDRYKPGSHGGVVYITDKVGQEDQ